MAHNLQRYVIGDIRSDRLRIALSRVTGVEAIHKFGANHTVGTTTEDIWTPGGIYPWPTSAQAVRIRLGGNAADTAAGAGARSVIIEGLDENWHFASEEVATAGASASAPTTTVFFRVFRALVGDAGTYTGNNTADILIENVSDTDLLAQIDAGYGRTQMSMFTTGADKFAILIGLRLTIGSNQLSNARVLTRENADVVSAPFGAKRVVFEADAFVGTEDFPLESAIMIPEKTDVWADGTAAASTASINVSYNLDEFDVEGLH